jgi:hypothetical protein
MTITGYIILGVLFSLFIVIPFCDWLFPDRKEGFLYFLVRWAKHCSRAEFSREKKDTFRELMGEYDMAFGNPQKRLAILQKAAKIAKSDSEKLEVNARLLDLKQRG